jgi:hypothetical protein
MVIMKPLNHEVDSLSIDDKALRELTLLKNRNKDDEQADKD